MKVSRENRNVYSNMGTEVSFSISNDSGNTAHLIDIISTINSSNPTRTAIRELIDNSKDASRENNNSTISIYISRVPDIIDAYYLYVEDFGKGINDDRMLNYVSKIGASTKREDETQTGAFGIGLCSIFNISTEQVFIITKYLKEESLIESNYILYRNSNNIPSFIKESERELDRKENCTGTIVKIFIEGNELIDKVLLYIIENCYLSNISINTNIHLLSLLREYTSSRYISTIDNSNSRDTEFLEGYYILDKTFYDLDIENRIVQKGNFFNNLVSLEEYYIDTYNSKNGKDYKAFGDILLVSSNDIKENALDNLIEGPYERYYPLKDYFDILYKILSRLDKIEGNSFIGILLGDSLYRVNKNVINEELRRDSKFYNLSYKNQIVLRLSLNSLKFSSNRESIILDDSITLNRLKKSLNNFYTDFKLKVKGRTEILSRQYSNSSLIDIIQTLKIFNFYKSCIDNFNEEIKVIYKNLGYDICLLYQTNYISSQDLWTSNKEDKINLLSLVEGLRELKNAYIVGPLNLLPEEYHSEGSINNNHYSKRLLSKFKENNYQRVWADRNLLELIATNKLSIVLSNSGSIKTIRRDIKSLNEAPFILIKEEDDKNYETIKESIASKLLGIISHKFNKSNRDINKVNSLNKSIRIGSKYKYLDLIISNERYSRKTSSYYDFTNKIGNKIDINFLPNTIYYTILNKEPKDDLSIFECYLADKIISRDKKKGYHLYYISESCYRFLKSETNKRLINYKKLVEKVYRYFYKNNLEICESFYSLLSEVSTSYNIDSLQFAYLLEKEFLSNNVKPINSAIEILEHSIIQDIHKEIIEYRMDKYKIYKESTKDSIKNDNYYKELGIITSLFKRGFYYNTNLRLTNRSVKNIIDWLFEDKEELIDLYRVVGLLNSYKIKIIDEETGRLNIVVKDLIKRLSSVDIYIDL